MKLVFIHGRAQEGKEPVALQTLWETAFDSGLANAGLTRPSGLESKPSANNRVFTL